MSTIYLTSRFLESVHDKTEAKQLVAVQELKHVLLASSMVSVSKALAGSRFEVRYLITKPAGLGQSPMFRAVVSAKAPRTNGTYSVVKLADLADIQASEKDDVMALVARLDGEVIPSLQAACTALSRDVYFHGIGATIAQCFDGELTLGEFADRKFWVAAYLESLARSVRMLRPHGDPQWLENFDELKERMLRDQELLNGIV